MTPSLKTLTLSLATLGGLVAQAQTLEQLGKFATVDASRFEIVNLQYSSRPLPCPPGRICAAVMQDTTVVTLEATHLCMDRIVGKVFTSTQATQGFGATSNKVAIFVGATEFKNRRSGTVHCMRAPITTVEVTIPGRVRKEQIVIENLEQSAAETR